MRILNFCINSCAFFLGGHDNGYLPTLAALENERLLQKIILLKGYHDIATELKHLNLPTLTLDNLFRTTKLSHTSTPYSRAAMSPAPTVSDIGVLTPVVNSNTQALNGDNSASNDTALTPKKLINPSLVRGFTLSNPSPSDLRLRY